MKKIIYFAVLLVFLISTYIYFKDESSKPLTADNITWSFNTQEPVGDIDVTPPQTRVTLKVPNERLEVGTYNGTCSEITEEQLLDNEIHGVICWFAGGGIELGIFNENGKVVLKKGEVDEGSAEEEGFRGDFKLVREL